MSKRSSGQSDTCHICHLKNPPQRDNKVLPKRTAKSTSLKEHTHINWICCDVCRLWCHSDCCGLTQKDHRKLTSGKQFFKCICCCISDSCWIKEAKYHSVAGDPELPSSVSSASAIDVTVTSQPNKHEVQLSDALPCNSGIGVNNHVNTEEVGVDTTNINSQPTEQVRDTSLSTEDIDLEVQQERQNIIIVDCISNPTQFTRSDNILREVQSFAPLIQVKYAYSLAKGGVAIHLNNTKDKLTLLNSFTAEAFGGAKISDLAERNYTLSLRNVPTYVDLETVRLALKEKSIEAKKLLRQQHKLTGRPQPVIKVVCTDTDANKLANHTFITVGRHTCDVVRNNARVLRCYNCQQFGHIALTDIAGRQQSVSTARDLTELQNGPVPYINNVMRFLQANIRSLNTSRSLLELTALTRRTEVMLLQEIWAEKGNANMRDFLPPLIKQREHQEGGGVAIFVHKTAKVVQLHKYDIKGLEAIWAEIMIGEVRVVAGSVYIPPGQFNQMILLREQLQKICCENPRVVLGMDANARSILWDEEVRADSSRATKKMGEMLVDMLLDNGMEVMNDGTHTYHKGQYSAALDVTAAKGVLSEFTVSWKVLDDDIRSDHCAIEFVIGEVTREGKTERKDWKNMDWGSYEQETEKVLQTILMEWQNDEPDVDEMTKRLTATINDVADGLVPTKIVCQHSKPWITKELADQFKKQRTAKRKWKHRRSPRNYAIYQKMVDDTEKMLTDAKQQWWESEISRLEEAPHEQKWKILDRLTDPCVRMGVQPIKVGGSYVFSDKEILNEMEKVHIHKDPAHITLPSQIERRVVEWIDEAHADSHIYPASNDLHNATITHEEILRTYDTGSNTPGPDGITALMIDKAHRETLTECLYKLWNKIWISHVIPTQWKLEHRKLIPKPGKDSYNDCSAYRTVSITDMFGKRLEKVVSARLTSELEHQGFDEDQFAYLTHRSSTQAVLSLVETIQRNTLSRSITGVLFFDFTDAFGSVNRTKLIYKLVNNFRISGRLLLYLVNFLSGRQARINVNDLIGEWIKSERGTSAGTVLGALLFLAYVQDTPRCIRPKFADDLVGAAVAKDLTTVQTSLQAVLDELSAWSDTWEMTLNTSKTKVMLFGSKDGKVNLTLNGDAVEQVDCIKYLGVWLDNNLTFLQQAEYAASKATKAAWKVNRLIDGRKGLTPKTGTVLYKCLIRPCWEFSIAAWANLPEKGIRLLEQVQARCLRTILGTKSHAATDAMEVIANVMPVRLRIQQLCALEYTRIEQKPQDSHLQLLLQQALVSESSFTTMRFLYYQAKRIHDIFDHLEIVPEHKIQAEEILSDGRIDYIDIFCGTDARKELALRDQVDAFITRHRHESLLAFTDGAVNEFGRGSSAVVMLRLELGSPEIEVKQIHATLISSLEAEIAALVLAMEQAIMYFEDNAAKSKAKQCQLIILSDCKSAIKCILRRSVMHHHHELMARVRSSVRALLDWNTRVVLAWIPSHSDIFFNEKADSLARQALQQLPTVSRTPFTFPTWKSLTLRQMIQCWQIRWDRSTTGRATYDVMQAVGNRSIFPQNRNVAISYVRLLLNDTTLREHQHRMGLADTKICENDDGIEDVYHFFFQCSRYSDIRTKLKQEIQHIWTDSGRNGSPRWSVALLLAPSTVTAFTKLQSRAVLAATFEFIQQSRRHL